MAGEYYGFGSWESQIPGQPRIRHSLIKDDWQDYDNQLDEMERVYGEHLSLATPEELVISALLLDLQILGAANAGLKSNQHTQQEQNRLRQIGQEACSHAEGKLQDLIESVRLKSP